MGALSALLWTQIILETAEGLARIIEMAQKAQAGEPVTKEDLVVARKRTDDAMTRLEAAVKAREENTDGN